MYIFDHISLSSYNENYFRQNFLRKYKKKLLNSFRKSCLFEVLEKYGSAGQATADNTAHAHCMLGNKGYSHTEYVILLFHYNNDCTKQPQCYVIRVLPVSLSSRTVAFLVLSIGTWGEVFWSNGATRIIKKRACFNRWRCSCLVVWRSRGGGGWQQTFSNRWVDLFTGFNSN
jgi:hypothetical protein